MTRNRFLRPKWSRLVIPAAIILVVFTALRVLGVDFSDVSREQFKEWVESMGYWGPAVYIALYSLRPLILFPAAVLSATAGIIWGAGTGFVILIIAAVISAVLEFFFARYSGRGLVEKHLGGKAEAMDKKIREHGFLTVLMIRLVPNAPWDVQNLSMGLTSVRFRDYFFATLLGIMPGSFALVFFGASFIEFVYNPDNFWIIGAAALVFFGVYYLKKYLAKKHGDKAKLE